MIECVKLSVFNVLSSMDGKQFERIWAHSGGFTQVVGDWKML